MYEVKDYDIARGVECARIGAHHKAFGRKIDKFIVFSVAIILLFITKDVPEFSVIVLDILFCTYLVGMFESKYKYCFYIHPVILVLSSQFFVYSFLDAGDGDSYVRVVRQYMDSKSLSFHGEAIFNSYSLIGFLRYANLGIVPMLVLPEYFYGNISETVYYLWQGLIHVVLSSIIVGFAMRWHIFSDKTLLAISLLAVVSPSFFDMGVAPTRHFVTFFGVFMLFVTHISLVSRITLGRLIIYGIACFVVLISKPPLFLPYMIYVIMDLVFVRRVRFEAKSLFFLFVVLCGIIFLGGYFIDVSASYLEDTANTGGDTFSGLTQYPLFGWVVKYIYALLSPFPWSNANYFIMTNYAGNGFLFAMHIFSALIGLYLYFVLLFKWKIIIKSDEHFKRVILFPVIMSTSIVAGSTGFHYYLLIYFPMLAPLFLEKKFRINILIPVGFVIILEAFLALYH